MIHDFLQKSQEKKSIINKHDEINRNIRFLKKFAGFQERTLREVSKVINRGMFENYTDSDRS